MELKRYQWVGLMAGVPLFSGAWLTAFYNTPWWGVLGLVIAVAGIYIGNKVEVRDSIETHALRGLIAGILAGVVARLLGVISMAISGGSGTSGFDSLADIFRVVLAGDWLSSILLIIVTGLLGVAVASLEPSAKQRKG